MDLWSGLAVEAAGGVGGLPVSQFHEAGAGPVEGRGWRPPGQLIGDAMGDDLGLGVGEHPGLGQELPAGEGDGGDVTDGEDPSAVVWSVAGSTGTNPVSAARAPWAMS